MNKLLLSIVLIATSSAMLAQVGIGTINPHASAILDIESTTKGFLPPRVSSDSDVDSPAEGLIIYDETDKCLNVYDNSTWVNLCAISSASGSGSGSGSGGYLSTSSNAYLDLYGTQLKFTQALTDGDQYRGGGIDENKNLFMWGRQSTSGLVGKFVIDGFNGRTPTSPIRANFYSPYFLSHPGINGQAEQFGYGNGGKTYYVLTTNGDIYAWGNNVNGALNDSDDNIVTPIVLPLVGVPNTAKVTEFSFFGGSERAFVVLTDEGKLYIKGLVSSDFGTIPTTSFVEIPAPSTTAGDPTFKYTAIITDKNQINSQSYIYLKGSDGKVYVTGKNEYYSFGDGSTTLNTSLNITMGTSIKEVKFPAGSDVIAISTNRYQHMAVDANGNAYAWGYYRGSVSSSTLFFEVDPSSPNISGTYVTEPTLITLPAGVNKVIDVTTHINLYVTGFVSDDNRAYVIGNLSAYEMHFIYSDDIRHHYSEILNFGYVKVKEMSLNLEHIKVVDDLNQVYWAGNSENNVAGGFKYTTPITVKPTRSESFLVPLLSGHHDAAHNFVQTIN